MICACCGERINPITQDFRVAQKSDPDEDWRYVTHHRLCLDDQRGFFRAEQTRDGYLERRRSLLKAAEDFRDEWQISDLDELIESLK